MALGSCAHPQGELGLEAKPPYRTGTIAAALSCVVGSIVMMGWQLGSAESLSMMILTGFAVDYVVHLSHAYMDSHSATRMERTHDALRDLGISVFWGMLTSVVSSGVLANLQLQFFSKFGTFFLLVRRFGPRTLDELIRA